RSGMASDNLCRSHPQGRQAERASRPGTGQVRAGDQPQDRQNTRSRCALDSPAARRRGDRMKRRDFITLIGGAAVTWPLAARAQQRARVYRVGWLFSSGEMSVQFSDPFQQSLREAGFVDGQNVLFERRFGRGVYERLPALAAELLALHVDLLAAIGTPA